MKRVLPGSGSGGRGGGGQITYTCVSKCKNDKIKKYIFKGVSGPLF
jgi:hypothetical protein